LDSFFTELGGPNVFLASGGKKKMVYSK
jgi:hypothetical protein